MSVLFADLHGFTSFSESNPPGAVRIMLNTYPEAVLPPVRAAGGRVDRFIGDAVMVTFNVSALQPNHAERAVRAALGLGFQQAAAEVAEQNPAWPRFRVGINTGIASMGVIGDGTQRTYTALGDTVNIASHIESRAPIGAIAITDATREAVLGAQVVSLGSATLKTRSEPVALWRLESLKGSDAPHLRVPGIAVDPEPSQASATSETWHG